jgi:hypothetical protein
MMLDWSETVFPMTFYGLHDKEFKAEARISEGKYGVRVTIDFHTDDADMIALFLDENVKDPEICQEYHIERTEELAIKRFNRHEHNPVAHGDGKPKWCDICGLTKAGKRPRPYRGGFHESVTEGDKDDIEDRTL